MKWVLIVIGAIILIPLAIRILWPVIKWVLKAVAWLLAVAFAVGGVIFLIKVRFFTALSESSWEEYWLLFFRRLTTLQSMIIYNYRINAPV